MDTLKALIKNVDEDYLIGLSNKGTVKRAAKDLEKESPQLAWEDGEAKVTLKEECCTLRSPLGESGCTCPSHSICRHIITAVLWMKQELAKEENLLQEKEQNSFQEILAIPAEKLKRACGSRHYRDFLAHMRAMEVPSIVESSIVTVELPWEKAVVKLLVPFSSSACTCHSKELCVHKAQAVLAYQMKKNVLSLKELEALQDTESAYDEEMIRQAAELVCETLGQQVSIGLSRQSYEEAESLERLAVIAHRAGLPELESGLRTLASGYQQYFSRSAALESQELLKNILAVYRRARNLEKAVNPAEEAGSQNEKIRRLAGVFRDAYEPVGKLHLTGMGGRTFSSKTGYEGEIYYFLETEQKKWYTWTDVRPTIYENTRKKPPAFSGGALAPWGLNCSRMELQKLEFELQNAKAARGGRLSVSQESKGEVIGTRNFGDEKISWLIEWDYERMLRKHFSGRMRDGENREEEGWEWEKESWQGKERLVLAGAVRWEESVFDTVSQQFSWRVFDKQGRTLRIALKYTKEERMTIQLLERLEKRLKGKTPESIVFFGSLYMDKEGCLCLYPIEVFYGEDFGGEDFSRKNVPLPETGENRKTGAVSREILTSMGQYVQEVENCLLDVFYSGLNSLQEEILSSLISLAEDGERLGLHQAGGDLSHIAGLLKEKRHQMEFSPKPVLEAMEELTVYLEACKEKLFCDMALLAMESNERSG